MKTVSLLLGSALFAASASAQYFSEGWHPGQPAYGTHAAAPVYTPGAEPPADSPAQPASGRSSFDFSKLLTEGPVGSLLGKVGVNLSAVFNATNDIWDPRIPLITDDNYDEIIVNEPLTPEEEEKRTWFIVISTTMGAQQQGGISKVVDKQFDEAYNITLVEGDLLDVRWGRIDYVNVTYITTKWNVWQGPWLVVLRDRGQSLRFYNARQVKLNATVMRDFLQEEGWKHTEPWSSSFAPGGNREFVLHYMAVGMKFVYDWLVRIPKFVLMIITGALGSLIMRLLHREPEKPQVKAQPTPKVQPKPKPAPAEPAPASPSPTKKQNTKSKKSGKK